MLSPAMPVDPVVFGRAAIAGPHGAVPNRPPGRGTTSRYFVLKLAVFEYAEAPVAFVARTR